MSATEIFKNACLNATVATSDSADIQAKYAAFLKGLKYIDSNDSIGKEIMFINRYLRADYTDSTTFLSKVKIFSNYVSIYVASTSTDSERKAAHQNITTSFADNDLFYPFKRTISTNLTNFTVGTNTDAQLFATINSASEIALDGENILIGSS
jgi:hypothetical protein